jgi:hypothetical protein
MRIYLCISTGLLVVVQGLLMRSLSIVYELHLLVGWLGEVKSKVMIWTWSLGLTDDRLEESVVNVCVVFAVD